MAPATFVRATTLPTPIPRRLASVRTRHVHLWRRCGCRRSIGGPGQPVSMLILVGLLPTLGWRGEFRCPNLSKILWLGPLVIGVRVLCTAQSPSSLRSRPVDGCCNWGRQFGLLVFPCIVARIEPRDNGNRCGPDSAVATSVMPPGEE